MDELILKYPEYADRLQHGVMPEEVLDAENARKEEVENERHERDF